MLSTFVLLQNRSPELFHLAKLKIYALNNFFFPSYYPWLSPFYFVPTLLNTYRKYNNTCFNFT